MNSSYPYIASLTREPFLFFEMRTTARLMIEGLADDEIVNQICKDNLFQYPTEKSIRKMAGACVKRLNAIQNCITKMMLRKSRITNMI